jgi:aspartate/methionine/tyrosine aminotransferase
VVVTPGAGYGKYGEGYIRLSVTAADADIDEGLSRLSAWSRAQGGKK